MDVVMTFVMKEIANVKIWITKSALFIRVEFARSSSVPNIMLSVALKQMVAQADAKAEHQILCQ